MLLMKTMVKFACVLTVALSALGAGAAGDLVTNATITKITVRNAPGATDELMKMQVSGGSGMCANAEIVFKTTGDADRDSRMLSLATAAYLSGKKIRAYDYAATAVCDGADFISIFD
jgi:hypothetical protein